MRTINQLAKNILLAVMLISPLLFSGQSWVYFTGSITDEVTGMPVPFHPVFISEADSVPLSFTSTNLDGFYLDSVLVDSSGFGAGIIVSTIDCNDFLLTKLFADPDSLNLADFEICSFSTQCEAAFVYEEDFTEPTLFHFTDFSIGNITSWFWDFGDGSNSTLQNPSHQYNSPGAFDVCLTVADSTNECLSIACEIIFVNDSSCISDFYWYQLEEPALTIAFEDLSSGEIDTWQWDFGDGQEGSNEQSPTHTYSESGYYLVSLLVSDSSKLCFSYSEQWLFVEELITCEASFVATLDTLNNTPYVYHFNNTSTGNYSEWYWDFGDGEVSQELNPTHTYSEGGTFEVCLFIFGTDSLNCFDTYCSSIVTPNYYNFGGHAFLGNYPLNIDENDSSNIAIASLYRKIENKWEFMDAREFWKFGYYWFVDKPEGDYLIRTDLHPQSDAYGDYSPAYLPDVRFWENSTTFTLNNNEEFSVDISLAEMAVLQTGIGNISGFVKPGDGCLAEEDLNDKLVYLLNSENEIVSYTYTNQFGEFEFAGLGFGTYQLRAEVTGKSGSTLSLTLNSENISESDVVLEVRCESFVGLPKDFASPGFSVTKIYPQPSSTKLTVEITGEINSRMDYTLFNIHGTSILSGNFAMNGEFTSLELNVDKLPPGLYLLRISETASSYSLTKKIIIN